MLDVDLHCIEPDFWRCSWAKLTFGSKNNTPGPSYPGTPPSAFTGPSSPNLDGSANAGSTAGGGLVAVQEEEESGDGQGGADASAELEMELEAGLEEEDGDCVDEDELEEETLPEGMSAPPMNDDAY